MARLALILYAIWCCGISWPRIALRMHKGKKADKNALADHCWGFCHPNLVWDQEGGLSHRAIDFLVEWVRLSEPQRVAKLGSFVILVLVLVAGVGWLC